MRKFFVLSSRGRSPFSFRDSFPWLTALSPQPFTIATEVHGYNYACA